MLAIFISILSLAFAADMAVIRAPQAELAAYGQYLTKTHSVSFAEEIETNLRSSSPDTSAMDQCLEALAFSAKAKSSVCFSALQVLKKQLWTPPLKRVLVPFLERLISGNLEHQKLYRELHKGLKEPSFRKTSGDLDLAIRDHRIFTQWLSKQAEWQDAKIFVNGVPFDSGVSTSEKTIVQWFLISNAGRTLSFIGTRPGFQKYLTDIEDVRFLDCQGVSSSAFELNSTSSVEYFFAPNCIVSLKKFKPTESESVYSRWQKTQQMPFQNAAKLEKPPQLPKWAIPVLLGVTIGAVALKGKKVSVRMPEL